MLPGPGIFIDIVGTIIVETTALPGEGFGVFDEAFGPLGAEVFEEIDASYLERVIDKTLEFSGAADGQMSLEDGPVKTGQGLGDKAGEPGEERA